MRNLRLKELLLIYGFGCPELELTTKRLLTVAMYATDTRLKKTINNLVTYLNKDGVAEWYEIMYYDIWELFSDDDTRPPGAGAMKPPENDCSVAA